jgi:hypothetical protein
VDGRSPSRAVRTFMTKSLRDLAPEILLGSTNVVDDVEHCLKANTSPHLAEQLTRSGELHVIDDFFHELKRYGTLTS